MGETPKWGGFEQENEHTRILGNLLHGVLIADGVLSEESNPTYPELVMFAEEYLKSKEEYNAI